MIQIMIGMCLALTGLINWTVPVFGFIVSGFPGTLIVLLLFCMNIILIRKTMRLDIRAWWTLLGFVLIGSVSFFITFFNHDYVELLKPMHLSYERMELLRGMERFCTTDVPVLALICLLVMIIFLLKIKPCFRTGEAQQIQHDLN